MSVVRLLCENAEVLTDVNDLACQYGQADLAIMMTVVRRLCESAETSEGAVELARQYGKALEKMCMQTNLERSIELLRSWLSPEQRADFDAHRCFDVIGCDTGRRYRVQAEAYVQPPGFQHPGRRYLVQAAYIRQAGIQCISDDGQIDRWCVYPDGIKHYGDIMLAQKNWLETDEQECLAQANKI